MKRIIRIIAAVLISLSFAHAEWIGEFPGLDKLIKEADAIVILRIDHSDGDFGGRELYSTHDCYIYQSLKGDIPTKKRMRLKLMDARQHSPNLFANHSTLLVFLTKKRAPSEPTDYRALETKGSAILLPPTGQEAAPEGETVSDKIRSILQHAIEYNEKEHEKEKSFLQEMIQEDSKVKK
ncbi:MAG: hypothetical protein NTW21_05870 [Verrucomicrobia bacterium]|nr:hypothetical protein [Verrucomicrobiota bacterium]